MFEGRVLRVLSDPPLSGFENMSRDEVLWGRLSEGGPLVLRFFQWREKTLSVGRFQRTSDIDREYLSCRGIPLVRRPTGGRAILHGEEMTLSLVLPEKRLSLRQSYETFKMVLREALWAVGVPVDRETTDIPVRCASPACFSLTFPHELAVGGRKIAGIAQARGQQGILFQVSLPLFLDREEFALCFLTKETILEELKKNFVSLGELGFSPQRRPELEKAMVEAFRKHWGVATQEDRWSVEEEENHRRLLEKKYLLPSYHWER
jgi:lipoate-protein ligase A